MIAAKVVLCLGVIFCVTQGINGFVRPEMLEKVQNDLERSATTIEKLAGKETLRALLTVKNTASNMGQLTASRMVRLCIDTMASKGKRKLEQAKNEILECVGSFRETLPGLLSNMDSIPDVMNFQRNFKKEIKKCKRNGILKLRVVFEKFRQNAKTCLRNPFTLKLLELPF